MAQATLVPTLPSEAEAILAKETSRVLAARPQTADPLQLRILDDLDDPGAGTIKLPASTVRMLIHIIELKSSKGAELWRAIIGFRWNPRSGLETGKLPRSAPSSPDAERQRLARFGPARLPDGPPVPEKDVFLPYNPPKFRMYSHLLRSKSGPRRPRGY